ncbi:lytic transglycosylase domain-containing protein [Sphingomonas koreensis]|nr:lytic transglycosylase domain-containing protein [Sphingomonas koreensis]
MVALFKSAFLVAGLSGLAVSAQMTPQQMSWYRAQLTSVAPQHAPPGVAPDPLGEALVEWKTLEQSDNHGFDEYANFLVAHPNWPDEKNLRIAAEKALGRSGGSPNNTVAFFKRYPPLTDDGAVAYAEALAQTGDRDGANAAARDAWTTFILSPDGEARLLGDFAGVFRADDHDKRVDMLLWRGATSAAQRDEPYVSPDRRAVFDARIAYLVRAPDASDRGMAVQSIAASDPGYIAARATWLINTGQAAVARSYLAQPHRLSRPPASVASWYKLLLGQARGAAADGRYQLAYDIARQVDDAYPAGADLSARPYAEKDAYTDLTWLAGNMALKKLGRPRDAVTLFDRYSKPFPTPQTRTRGLYWAGRAAAAAGDTATARGYFNQAAVFGDAYYGQLSEENLGLPLRAPAPTTQAVVPEAERAAFYNRETVRAAQMLGTLGNWSDQTAFVRQIAANATSDSDHRLGIELSRTLNRPDLGVMLSRSALQNGLDDYMVAGYPSVPVPPTVTPYWTMIHAISRQESQFDRQIVSHAGAIGLMQLMPGTARETATRMGLSYNVSSLNDAQYNIQLGANYFQRLFGTYGSYPLAIAAYNAGPGNVNKWLAANGDPRTGAVDMVDWIEQIPISETRTYVQRVLENAVVYDLLNPSHAQSRGQARLAWYLGRRPGGNEMAAAAPSANAGLTE